MSTLREAAQQALEALEDTLSGDLTPYQAAKISAALRAALAEPVQEPYCYVYEYDSPFGLHREFYPRTHNGSKPSRTVPLYTAPPQRKPLTDEFLRKLHHMDEFGLFCDYDEFEQIVRAIESAHGIKEEK